MDWTNLLQNFGVAVVSLVAMAFAIVIVSKFIAREVFLPFRDKMLTRLMTFFDRLDVTLDKLDRATDNHGTLLIKLQLQIDRIEGKVDSVCSRLKIATDEELPTLSSLQGRSSMHTPPSS